MEGGGPFSEGRGVGRSLVLPFQIVLLSNSDGARPVVAKYYVDTHVQ